MPAKKKKNTSLDKKEVKCSISTCEAYTEYESQMRNIKDLFFKNEKSFNLDLDRVYQDRKTKKLQQINDFRNGVAAFVKCREMNDFLAQFNEQQTKTNLANAYMSMLRGQLHDANKDEFKITANFMQKRYENISKVFKNEGKYNIEEKVMLDHYLDEWSFKIKNDEKIGDEALQFHLKSCNKNFCNIHNELPIEPKFFEYFEQWLKLHHGDDHSKRINRIIKQMCRQYGLTLDILMNEQVLMTYIQEFVRDQSKTLSELYPVELQNEEKQQSEDQNKMDDVDGGEPENNLLSSNTVYKFANAVRLCTQFLDLHYDDLDLYCKQLSTRLKNYEEGVHLVILYDFNTTKNIMEHIILCLNQIGKELTFTLNWERFKNNGKVPQFVYEHHGHIHAYAHGDIVRNTYTNLVLNLFICPISSMKDSWHINEDKNIVASIGNRFSDACSKVVYKVDEEYHKFLDLVRRNFTATANPNVNNQHLQTIAESKDYALLGLHTVVVAFLKKYVHTLYAAYHTYRNSKKEDFFNISLFSRYLTMAKVGMATSQYTSHYKGLQSAEYLEQALIKFKKDLSIEAPDMKSETEDIRLDVDSILHEKHTKSEK
jgi:hypothetical protein